MVDLKSQYQFIQKEVAEGMAEVFENTAFINGPMVKAFQSDLEAYLSVKHVIPCANGTDALQIALMGLKLLPGDEVITADFTFAATVEVISLLKLKPVLILILLLLKRQLHQKLKPLFRSIYSVSVLLWMPSLILPKSTIYL